MSVAHDEILKSALSLPEADRILLATELLDSVAEGSGVRTGQPNRQFGGVTRPLKSRPGTQEGRSNFCNIKIWSLVRAAGSAVNPNV